LLRLWYWQSVQPNGHRVAVEAPPQTVSGLEEGLVKFPNEVVPYKILPLALEAIQRTASSRLRVFNNMK
jgi:hypothetical protein